ncbi:MAG: Asp-tRNA(Asn)/Glu-tRNA(Gln) amidotransferase subunit GatC [Alphaproteobacteria bacterium]|nr:Asp-tRNA(Asn)/Glu-tRNA(Gln) amidotransferase subunit GatC [Alphaproteobacteria bacterium]
MSFTKQQLQKFAHLIRLDVSDEKLNEMKIDGVIDWLDKLQKIDTSGVTPMLTPAEHLSAGALAKEDALPLRDDVVTDGNIRDAVLANVPDDAGKTRGYFSVPKVIDED